MTKDFVFLLTPVVIRNGLTNNDFKHYYMKNLWLALMVCTLTASLSAQKEDDQRIVIKNEKVVTVDVTKGDSKRNIKVVTEEDGKEKVIQWSDDGEIPTEVMNQLKEQGIDVKILQHDEGDMEREIEIEVSGDDRNIFIMDGEKDFDIEWNGDGDMPEDIRELLEENDVNVDIIKENEDGEVKVKIIKKGTHDGLHKGNHFIEKRGKKGEKRVVKKRMRKGPKHGHRNLTMIHEEEPISNAYMGAHIGTRDNGVEILELIKDSPADRAKLQVGDIIQKINGARTKNVDKMMTLLGMFEPNDEIQIDFIRGGESKSAKLTLAERPDHRR